jgi:hypothetical protein
MRPFPVIWDAIASAGLCGFPTSEFAHAASFGFVKFDPTFLAQGGQVSDEPGVRPTASILNGQR